MLNEKYLHSLSFIVNYYKNFRLSYKEFLSGSTQFSFFNNIQAEKNAI